MMALVRDAGILGRQAVLRSARNPASIIGAVVFPLLFFALFNVIMRKIMEARGFDYQQLLPSAIVAQAMLFAAMSSAYFVAEDRLVGLTARFHTMPVHRFAPLLGRGLADAARASASLLVLLIVGIATGMRFKSGWQWLPAYVVVAVLFALAASLVFATLGRSATTPDAAVALASIIYLPLFMLSSAFVPVDDFPGWMQGAVRHQPVSAVIDALRALTGNGDIASTVAVSVLWSAGLIMAFGWFATRVGGGAE